MSRPDPAIEQARQRMLDADAVENKGLNREDWSAWQQAATDYWVLLHPDLARYRRRDPFDPPSIQELRERADQVDRAMDGVPDQWRLARPSADRTEHLARAGWFHEQLARLYEPVYDAIERIRRGDSSGAETLVRFLEADVYCFRSGYAKAEAIRFLIRADLAPSTIKRLRSVVLTVVQSYDRREFRAYVRLARRVDAVAFRQELQALAGASSSQTARRATWVLAGLPPKP